MSADDQLQGVDERRSPAGPDTRGRHQPPGRSDDHTAPDTAADWEDQEQWLASSDVVVDTVGDLVPASTPPPARRRRRTEWWLLVPLALALIAIIQLVLTPAWLPRCRRRPRHRSGGGRGPGRRRRPLPHRHRYRRPASAIARTAWHRWPRSTRHGPAWRYPRYPGAGCPGRRARGHGSARGALREKSPHVPPNGEHRQNRHGYRCPGTRAVEHDHRVDAAAAAMEPNVMGLKVGERLTLEALLYGLMLDSGNDAAEVIAWGVFGDRARFIRLMNDLVTKLGLQNTHFANPSGFDDPGTTCLGLRPRRIGDLRAPKPESSARSSVRAARLFTPAVRRDERTAGSARLTSIA